MVFEKDVMKNMNKAKIIEIFLPVGNPKMLRICTMKNRSIEVFHFTRSSLLNSEVKEYLAQKAGTYILLGKEFNEKSKVYIGESGDVEKRIIQHMQDESKGFFNDVFMIKSNNNDFTKAHILYLQEILTEKAKQVSRCQVLNKAEKALTNERLKAEIEEVVEIGYILFSVLGLDIFEELPKQDDKILICKDTKGNIGNGKSIPEGFLVFKGARCRKERAPSFKLNIEHYIQNNILVDKGEFYELAEDTIFTSPSFASCLILGRSSNGQLDWKDKVGKTLKELTESNL